MTAYIIGMLGTFRFLNGSLTLAANKYIYEPNSYKVLFNIMVF